MIKQRRSWARNYTPEQLKRIENRQCPNCGKPKSEWHRRTDWTCCSRECSKEFYDKNLAILDWAKIRIQAFERDNYTCQHCGKKPIVKLCGQEVADTDNLIGDHITPIACGGDEFDINNVQTLCTKCNKIKTKRDLDRIARVRKREKQVNYDIEMQKFSFPQQKELEI